MTQTTPAAPDNDARTRQLHHADNADADANELTAEHALDDDAADDAADAEADAAALTFTVAAEEAGARLDAFLAARVADMSRTRLKLWVEDGEVLVNQRAAKPAYKLRAGEVIELDVPPPLANNFAPEDLPLDIVFEDDALVVVNKAAGMVVHPAAGAPSGTLANALAYHFRQLPTGGDGSGGGERPGIVHRLDRDTSGLMVVAKTEAAHESLSDQFRAREVFKSYAALVHGRVAEERGRIEEPLARDPRHKTRMAVVRGGRAALSLYHIRQPYDRFTFLDVRIKTGRTHQIRVHLAWLKHPVVGDKVYGGGRDNTVPDVRQRAAVNALGRQFLHAEQLAFTHPRTLERLRFRAALPPDLQRVLDALEPPA